jgi:hypothetical protein
MQPWMVWDVLVVLYLLLVRDTLEKFAQEAPFDRIVLHMSQRTWLLLLLLLLVQRQMIKFG